MLPMLNACPGLSLIDAAAAGAHVCIVRDSRTNEIIFRLPEDRGVLPVQLPVSGNESLVLAEELAHERAEPAISLGLAHAFLCLVADFDPATPGPPALSTGTVMASSRKCSHGHVHDEFAQYHLMHELYGHRALGPGTWPCGGWQGAHAPGRRWCSLAGTRRKGAASAGT
jgi:hypothetical protein